MASGVHMMELSAEELARIMGVVLRPTEEQLAEVKKNVAVLFSRYADLDAETTQSLQDLYDGDETLADLWDKEWAPLTKKERADKAADTAENLYNHLREYLDRLEGMLPILGNLAAMSAYLDRESRAEEHVCGSTGDCAASYRTHPVKAVINIHDAWWESVLMKTNNMAVRLKDTDFSFGKPPSAEPTAGVSRDSQSE